MPNDDFYIICPYYHKAMGNTIFCTGVSEQKDINCNVYYKQVFPTRNDRNNRIINYCSGFNFGSCCFAELNNIRLSK